ncbi:MAG: Hsp70 family protein [Desulfobacterales bacterium]|nr:Hsp70 family protein [Desulfobacterales bacterium]
MSAIFGMDFGTSNSAISANIDGQVSLVNVDSTSPIPMSLKSVLYFYKDEGPLESYAGYDAVREYMDNEGEGRFMQSIKTFLPHKTFQSTDIYNKNHTLEQLTSLIIKTVKDKAEKSLGREINDVVMGRPVVFSEEPEADALAQERLTRAAKLAGFKNITYQLEPIAAAFSYENTLEEGVEKKVLVGDFGAGTSDFTIVKCRKGGNIGSDRKEDVLSISGVDFGGDVFDSKIMWEKVCQYFGRGIKARSQMSGNEFEISPIIMRQLRRWHLIPQLRRPRSLKSIEEFKHSLTTLKEKRIIENLENLIHFNYGYKLFQSIERAKCTLSSNEAAQVLFKDYNIEIEEDVTREEFEGYIEGEAQRIDQCINTCLSDAGLSAKDIDLVFLTGGSSHIPLVRNVFERKFNPDAICQSDAFTSVAFGLGLYGSNLI